MPLSTLTTVIYTAFGCISCYLSFCSHDENDRGHGHRYRASSSHYGSITTQPTRHPPPSPSSSRSSYARTTIIAPTTSDNHADVSRSSRVSPPHGGRPSLITPHSGPFASSSSGDPRHEVTIGPCRREAIRNDAPPLSSLLNLPNGVFSEDDDIVRGASTAEDLRENARRLKREEKEAYKKAKRACKRREYSAEAAHKQEALARKCAAEFLNKKAAKIIFSMKNKGRTDGLVDLHGLYVDEALEYAEQEFQLARKDKVVRFIVGKGLHARDGKAKIRPALEKLCRERDLKHHRDPKNDGILVVQC